MKTETISVRLAGPVYAAVNTAAQRNRQTLADYVRGAVAASLRQDAEAGAIDQLEQRLGRRIEAAADRIINELVAE